ncbi:hypothetical protein BDV24DRAFT_159876 [Aspergillus arachidicola]|uniref:Xylanolytic transcriptional activator regulatory domain-containing protein n=1 Tax=Aspergillus arachidicola TaxID=656916 RepID=A0A5N6YHU5_9EURO|nr:hypothetical protein BDV24DRAFT_159876 [Aspergillus arachidicola]
MSLDRRGKLAEEAHLVHKKEALWSNSSSESHGTTAPRSTESVALHLGPPERNSHQHDITRDSDPHYWMKDNVKSKATVEDAMPSKTRPVNWSKWLPCYAGPLSPSITREHCKVLQREGAFVVPDTGVRDELLRAYIQFVHPAMPVLDLETFLMAIDSSYEGNERVSFLLFQAVMFAASAFQTPESVALEKFHNQQEVRQARFDKVRTLYSSGCEDDRVTLLQTVLLMTYWDGGPEEEPCAPHYISVARAILKAIQMSPTDSETRMFQEQPRLWTRIQWSIYTRDRLVALNMQLPYQMKETEFQAPILKPSDLETGPVFAMSWLGGNGSYPAIRDPFIHGLRSQMSICLAQLCKWISRILPCQPDGIAKGSRVLPKLSITGAEILLRDSELKEWRSSLPDLLRWCPSSPLRGNQKHGNVVITCRAMLNGIYNLASYTLHQPQLVSVSRGLPEILELSRRRVRLAVSEITQTYRFFRSKGSIYGLPDGQVAMLEAAISTHLNDLESPSPSTRAVAVDGFQLCAQGLQQIGDIYPSANTALARVDAAIRGRDPLNQGERIAIHQTTEKDLEPQEPSQNNSLLNHSHQANDSTLSEQIESLKIPQISALLSSHFMMTPSERALLQDLASPAATALEPVYEDTSDSSSPHTTATDVDHSAINDVGLSPTYLASESDWFRDWNADVDTSLISLSRATRKDFEFHTEATVNENWDFFHMMSQSYAE